MEKITSNKTYRGHTLIKALGLTVLILLILLMLVETAGANQLGQSELLNPDGSKMYECFNYLTGVCYIKVTDVATNTIIATINFDRYDWPKVLAITPDGKTLYAGDDSGFVTVIDTTENKIINKIWFGSMGANGICISPNGKKVYLVANSEATNNLGILDAATNDIQRLSLYDQDDDTIAGYIKDISFSTYGKYAYVTLYRVYVLDVDTNNILEVTQPGQTPSISEGQTPSVPEFPSVIVPLVAVLGLTAVMGRRKE